MRIVYVLANPFSPFRVVTLPRHSVWEWPAVNRLAPCQHPSTRRGRLRKRPGKQPDGPTVANFARTIDARTPHACTHACTHGAPGFNSSAVARPVSPTDDWHTQRRILFQHWLGIVRCVWAQRIHSFNPDVSLFGWIFMTFILYY